VPEKVKDYEDYGVFINDSLEWVASAVPLALMAP
jgi:hypothetical protein